MNTKIQSLAANFFAPSKATPQERKFEVSWAKGEPGKVLNIRQLDYPSYYAISVGVGANASTEYHEVMTELRISKDQILQPGDIMGLSRGYLTHNLGEVRAYKFESDLERAELLLEIIKQWAGKPITCFCNGEGALPHFDYKKWLEVEEGKRDESPLGWKDPSTCGSCQITQEIIGAVLGKRNAPFIISHGSRCYGINLQKLMTFVAEGPEALAKAEKQKQEEAVRAERKRYEGDVTKALKGAEVSEVIQCGLVEFKAGGGYWSGIKVVSKDLVLSYGDRHEHGSVGGVGMFHEVRVWYKGQTDRKDWQWRDRYNASADRPNLYINGIGEVIVKSDKGEVEIKVELENIHHGSRFTTFTFEDKEVQAQPVLSSEDQAEFVLRADAEIQRVLGKIMGLLPHKPYMLLPTGQGAYREPSIKQRVVNAGQGVAAFVTEEQIDHLGTDRQIQFKLFVVSAKDSEAHQLLEDHAYEQREGSRVITIVDLTSEKVVVNTQDGSKTINLS